MFRLFRYLGPYWLRTVLLLIAIAAQTWFGLQLPALMAKIVNRGIVEQDMSFIWQTGFLMLLFATLAALGALVSSFLSATLGTALARDIRKDIYKKVLKFSIAETEQFSTASLITRTTNDVAQVQTAIVLCLSMLLRAPMMCIVAIIQAFATAPDMTWIIALAVVILLSLVVVILSVVVPKFKIYQKLVDKITLITRENLTGLRVVRAFNNQSYEQKKFTDTNHQLRDTDIFIGKVMALQSPLMMLIFNGTTLLCIWIGVQHITENMAYLGNMMAFMQYAVQVIMSFLFMTILFVMLPRANVSAGRINEVLNAKSKIVWPTSTKGIPEVRPSVEFKHVSFSYPGASEPVLQDISFIAKAGETTAFIGSTGSGKSTLINLIPRFHEATSGEVLVNNINVKDYAEDDLMNRIGHVPQRAFLFSGDINSNITFGAENASAEQVERAAEIAQAKEFIKKLKSGYFHRIAEGGTNVSGGQKQRLSIARALAKNPQVYIFDDAFSALDMKTDAKLRAALKDVTTDAVTLIVAQRVGTIKQAEQIIVLNEGKMVGRGDHYHLLNTCAIYREITKSQLSDAEYAAELKKAERQKERSAHA